MVTRPAETGAGPKGLLPAVCLTCFPKPTAPLSSRLPLQLFPLILNPCSFSLFSTPKAQTLLALQGDPLPPSQLPYQAPGRSQAS